MEPMRGFEPLTYCLRINRSRSSRRRIEVKTMQPHAIETKGKGVWKGYKEETRQRVNVPGDGDH